jgi:hypothetical protein
MKQGHPEDHGSASEHIATRATRLSYKFQRLRERLREAIRSGELSGKLPGERQLAVRFEVNAKTLSKALTDLAAEGLLERTIGRGTFVRGAQEEAPAPSSKPLLVLCDAGWIHTPLVETIRARADVTLRTLDFTKPLRPSYLARYRGVIAIAASTDHPVLADIAVRAMPLVLVAREPKTLSVNAVLFDREMAVRRVVRELILRGHTRFYAVECTHAPVVDTLRAMLSRCGGPTVTVDSGDAGEAVAAYRAGATAIVAASARLASLTIELLADAGIVVPRDITIAGVGGVIDAPPCGGVFVRVGHFVDTVVGQIDQPINSRPQTLWLAGEWSEGTTIEPLGQPGAATLRQYDDLASSIDSVV